MKKHIARPASASEIIKALHITKKDVTTAKNALKVALSKRSTDTGVWTIGSRKKK